MIAKHSRNILTHALLSFVLVFATLLMPAAAVFAEDCVAPTSTTPGVHVPTGADAGTYHYDCTLNLWVNDHFRYDPATAVVTPIEPVTYVCNATTHLYDYSVWLYNSPKGIYVLTPYSASTPPAGSYVIACPTPYSASISNTGEGSTNTTGLGGSINNTGADSTNTIGGDGTNSAELNNDTAATINNTIVGTATSGSAAVLSNTFGGSANSGETTDIANVVNLLQSQASGFSQGDLTTFSFDINGDVNGDFILDPALLSTIQPTAGSPNLNNELDINNEVSASINNNIAIDSTSGDATVDSNTNAGDATTGDATAIANIINMINSAVSSGQSFIGTININGNLNGDILLPPDFVDQLIAANVPTATISFTGANSTNTIDEHPQGTNTTITNDNDLGITNNIDATAASGSATLSQNTNAGSATTGNATTSITAFNLTGSQIIGSNALLVFVNVMGSWVGLIVNAPAGSTAAALGGGITTNTAGYNTTNIDNDVDASITNNVGITARSGDATLSRNTNAGNAKTGNARVGVNLLNIQNSSLSVGNWFGILFINVFGNWNGSFGINTAAGDPVSTGGVIPSSLSGGTIADAAQLVSFAPHFKAVGGSSDAEIPQTVATVLAAQTTKGPNATSIDSPTLQGQQRSYFLPVLAVVLFVSAIFLEQIASRKPTS